MNCRGVYHVIGIQTHIISQPLLSKMSCFFSPPKGLLTVLFRCWWISPLDPGVALVKMSAAVNSLWKMKLECEVKVGDEGRRRQRWSIIMVSHAAWGFSSNATYLQRQLHTKINEAWVWYMQFQILSAYISGTGNYIFLSATTQFGCFLRTALLDWQMF